MPRLKLTIAYDGRPYKGWQIQPNGSTVQAHIEKAIEAVSKESVRIHASGRTDTGVHANCQVAHFDSPTTVDINPYNWVPALNTKLPSAIRILTCEEVADTFHSRFDAVSKTYIYDIITDPVLHPLSAGLAWHLPRQLDPTALEEALNTYIGTHDFRNFAALRGNETEDTDYTRTLTVSSLTETPNGYRLTYAGTGFLYKMVRILTGTAIQVAQGRLRLDDHADLLHSPFTEKKNPLCAPPDGLTLEFVQYPE